MTIEISSDKQDWHSVLDPDTGEPKVWTETGEPSDWRGVALDPDAPYVRFHSRIGGNDPIGNLAEFRLHSSADRRQVTLSGPRIEYYLAGRR